jgi:mRNA-degrading endonuclease toxin of MazEF toxin-antitoxin module
MLVGSLAEGEIVLIDWRGDGLRQEPNKLRPCVVVEDHGLFEESFPNVLIVPLADDSSYLIPSLCVRIEPTPENGCTKPCFAVSHSITVASKHRIARLTSSRIDREQLNAIRAQIAICIGL